MWSDASETPAGVETHATEEPITRIDGYQTYEVTKRLHIAEDAEEYSTIRILILIRLRATPATSAVDQEFSSDTNYNANP
jgi:hypothetical protein